MGVVEDLVLLQVVSARARRRQGIATPDDLALLAQPDAAARLARWDVEKAALPDRGPIARVQAPERGNPWAALLALVPILDRTESPAEQAMLLAAVTPSPGRRVVLLPPTPPLLISADGRCLELDAQVVVGGHRLDFVLRGASGRQVAIEVDGFAYHERTQEQAERDRSRDRELLALGTVTTRFMAKTVFEDPTRCVDEAFALALGECVALELGTAMGLERSA